MKPSRPPSRNIEKEREKRKYQRTDEREKCMLGKGDEGNPETFSLVHTPASEKTTQPSLRRFPNAGQYAMSRRRQENRKRENKIGGNKERGGESGRPVQKRLPACASLDSSFAQHHFGATTVLSAASVLSISIHPGIRLQPVG